MPLKLYATLGVIAALVAGLGWHKHVVGQRDHYKAAYASAVADLKAANAAVADSERLRKAEHAAAVEDLERAGADADARVKEARRSAGAIKRIVEKPHAKLDPINGCPVPELVSDVELRDALQPNPFGDAEAAEPVGVREAEARATPAVWGDDHPPFGPGVAGGDPGVPELGVGVAGVGEGPSPRPAGAGELAGVPTLTAGVGQSVGQPLGAIPENPITPDT